MRVLFFSNSGDFVPLNQKQFGKGYNNGGWVAALINELKQRKDIHVGVCFAMKGQTFKSVQKDVTYYSFPNFKKNYKDKWLDLFYYKRPERDRILWPHFERHFKKAIEDFKPDVIEIFGSEVYLGLATFVAPCPVVLHVQGILSLYIYTWFPPGVSLRSYLLQDWKPKRIFQRFQLYIYWQRSCYREQEVLRHTKHVIGRTHWDKMATEIFNPERVYHYGGEILRPVFYEEHERVIPKRLTIVTTSSSPMYKGFDYILQTANILKNVMRREFDWLVFGNVHPTFAEKFTHLKYDELNIKLMGVASAEELVKSIINATVYFQPSYIENSPNSVCEAQILGVSVVATNVGGTASLIEDGKTGFLIPTNDPYTAAYRIMEIYNDEELNKSIGHQAREIALKRHDRKTIVDELLNTYRALGEDCKGSSAI